MNKQSGFSLIEVLVAMIVLAFGLLGLAGMQATGLKNNQSAYNRSQATQLAYDIADRMRANASEARNLAASTYITLAPGSAAAQSSCESVSTACTPALMAQNDLSEWNADLAALLPGGTGSLAVDVATGIFTATVNWTENRDEDNDAVSDVSTFTTRFQL
ncbi:MAG: type IV pilus modification protein PilV [Gammaproteobacteria bacterium HGW-Gammaproteobacteria-3]|nr:MAG: type IV pilus modification protein PilV [Gammaproteobacteria bacterium HGW-Gammaproteobacteria-3]